MARRLLPDSDEPAATTTWRQRAFAHEYVANGRNATLAYQTVYECSPGTADHGGYRLLSKPLVRALVDALEAELSEQVQLETGITLARTVQELARIAFLDPRRLFEADGTPRPIRELDDDTAAAIDGLDIRDVPLIGATVTKYKLSSKMSALDALMKHLGGYARNNALDVSVTDKTEVSMAELARRAAFLFRVGGDEAAANEAAQPPRQAAS